MNVDFTKNRKEGAFVSEENRQSITKHPWFKPVSTVAILLGLVVLLATNTTVVSADKSETVASGLNPSRDFNPADFAAELFPGLQAGIEADAVDLQALDIAVTADPQKAVSQYGQDLGAGSFVFPVTALATVTSVDDKFIYLSVEGISDEKNVLIPIAGALNGGPVRDATGEMEFGDVPDQIAYQTVAQEIKKLMISSALDPLDLPTLTDKKVTFFGAWKNGGPQDTYILQPTEITVQ